MRSAGWLLLGACGLGAAGCGSSGDGPPPTCTPRVLSLMGDLDAQPVDVQVNETSLSFDQLSKPYTLIVGYANGVMHIEWNTPVAQNGAAAAATGVFGMPAGAPHGGETICAASGSIREIDDSTGTPTGRIFTLGTLSSGANCPGAALAGSISGCAGE